MKTIKNTHKITAIIIGLFFLMWIATIFFCIPMILFMLYNLIGLILSIFKIADIRDFIRISNKEWINFLVGIFTPIWLPFNVTYAFVKNIKPILQI